MDGVEIQGEEQHDHGPVVVPPDQCHLTRPEDILRPRETFIEGVGTFPTSQEAVIAAAH